MWYSYPFQAHIRAVRLRLTPTYCPQPGQSQGCSQSPCPALVPTPCTLITLPAEWLVQNPLRIFIFISIFIFFIICILFLFFSSPPPGEYCNNSRCLNSSFGRWKSSFICSFGSDQLCLPHLFLRHRIYFLNENARPWITMLSFWSPF